MTEVLNELTDWLVENWQILVLWITTPIVCGLSIAEIIRLIYFLVKKKRKNLSNIEALNKKIDAVSEKLALLDEKIEKAPEEMVAKYKGIEKEAKKQKRKIYDAIINGEQQVKEATSSVEEIIDKLEDKKEEVVEKVVEEVKEDTKEILEEKVIAPNKKVVIINE